MTASPLTNAWQNGYIAGRAAALAEQHPAHRCPYFGRCSAYPVTVACEPCPVGGPHPNEGGAA